MLKRGGTQRFTQLGFFVSSQKILREVWRLKANCHVLPRCREFYNEQLRNKEEYSLKIRITLRSVIARLTQQSRIFLKFGSRVIPKQTFSLEIIPPYNKCFRMEFILLKCLPLEFLYLQQFLLMKHTLFLSLFLLTFNTYGLLIQLRIAFFLLQLPSVRAVGCPD